MVGRFSRSSTVRDRGGLAPEAVAVGLAVGGAPGVAVALVWGGAGSTTGILGATGQIGLWCKSRLYRQLQGLRVLTALPVSWIQQVWGSFGWWLGPRRSGGPSTRAKPGGNSRTTTTFVPTSIPAWSKAESRFWSPADSFVYRRLSSYGCISKSSSQSGSAVERLGWKDLDLRNWTILSRVVLGVGWW